MKNLTAIIEQAEEGGYFAYCPEVSGANGQGESIEDTSQCFRGYSAENLAVIRHVGLNLLSRDKKTKIGVKTKRLKAGWDDNYLKDILNAFNIVTL